MSKIAVIQEAPVFLDKEKTIAKACRRVKEAAANGAQLALFPETFIPGYPTWIWRLRPGSDGKLSSELHNRLFDNAVDISSDDLAPLLKAAKDDNITVVCGINEREKNGSKGTLYNSLITINHQGKIINRHRKLMPTNPERMTWGQGDASGLNVFDTPVGRVGGLICWENFMPLARFALYSQGIELYVAPTYDEGEGWIGTMQHIAREGRCWVASCGSVIEVTDIPDNFPEKNTLYSTDEQWINPGDSVIIAPGGEIVCGPLSREKGILYHDIDLDKVASSRKNLDVAGHYARPELLQLKVNKKPQQSVIFED